MSEEYEHEPELLSTVQALLKFNPAVHETVADETLALMKCFSAWKQMELKFSGAGLLKAYQRMRRLRQLPDDVVFFLIAQSIACLVEELGAPPELKKVDDRIRQIERAHGLGEDEDWRVHEGPVEWQLAQDEWNVLNTEFELKVMRDHGEEKLAALYAANKAEYDARHERGRRAVYGSNPSSPDA